MPRKRGSKDIAPEIRGGFIRAMKILEDGGRPISTLILEAIDEHGILKVLEVMAKFTPKEVDLDANIRTIEDFVLATVQEQQTIEHDSSDRLQ